MYLRSLNGHTEIGFPKYFCQEYQVCKEVNKTFIKAVPYISLQNTRSSFKSKPILLLLYFVFVFFLLARLRVFDCSCDLVVYER